MKFLSVSQQRTTSCTSWLSPQNGSHTVSALAGDGENDVEMMQVASQVKLAHTIITHQFEQLSEAHDCGICQVLQLL